MKNKERFAQEIVDIAIKGCTMIAVNRITGKPVKCSEFICGNCAFNGMSNDCNELRKEWAEAEYEDKILRWIKDGEFVPIYRCPKCGKEALQRVVFIDNFEDVQSPFCPFCGVRLQNAE